MRPNDLDTARGIEAQRIFDADNGATAVLHVGAIAARLAREGWEPPVDPDLIEARKIVHGVSLGKWSPEYREGVLTGRHDDSTDLLVAIAAIKRGRELAVEEMKSLIRFSEA